MQIVDGTVCRYQRAGDCAVALLFAMMPTPDSGAAMKSLCVGQPFIADKNTSAGS